MTARKKESGTGGNPKILVIEDDRLFSDIYAAKFAEEGFDVLTSSNGEDGFRKIVGEKPDVVLLDIVLPKVTGLEMLEQVRAHADPAVRDVPVIVVTNLNQETYVEKMRAFGVKAYFVKANVFFSQVLEKINEILDAGH
ncbi:MAG: hypothetical protein RL272_784 [Candidatus Parcubacteria bacterium]|jgi:DNA-binding response OmpR family regulator